jgi:MOSC domain-containing protein YiiM
MDRERHGRGRVTALYLRPSARTPVRSVPEVVAVAGRGLDGDHAGGGSRQVTLLDLGAWHRACAELERDLEPGLRRANVVVEGLSLVGTRGLRLAVGECVVEVVGETAPCRLMDDAAFGLQTALRPEGRGGVYGRIVRSGRIRVGDPVGLAGPDA